MIQSQRGIITVDFVFALVIGFGMSALLFAMTMTLSVVEITQYISFSAARSYAAAQKNPADQDVAARTKYDRLINNPTFSAFFQNGWFQISPKSSIEIRGGATDDQNQGSFSRDYPSVSPNREIFMGVRTKLTSKVLSLKLPLVGQTSEDEDGFSTRVISILIREPTQDECQNLIKARYSAIMSLDKRYQIYSNHQSDYVAMEDNGC